MLVPTQRAGHGQQEFSGHGGPEDPAAEIAAAAEEASRATTVRCAIAGGAEPAPAACGEGNICATGGASFGCLTVALSVDAAGERNTCAAAAGR